MLTGNDLLNAVQNLPSMTDELTKDQVLKKLADGLIEYWHDEEGDASDILPDLIISILRTEYPELLQQTEKLSEQLFNEND
jgi:hypothetical protein